MAFSSIVILMVVASGLQLSFIIGSGQVSVSRCPKKDTEKSEPPTECLVVSLATGSFDNSSLSSVDAPSTLKLKNE